MISPIFYRRLLQYQLRHITNTYDNKRDHIQNLRYMYNNSYNYSRLNSLSDIKVNYLPHILYYRYYTTSYMIHQLYKGNVQDDIAYIDITPFRNLMDNYNIKNKNEFDDIYYNIIKEMKKDDSVVKRDDSVIKRDESVVTDLYKYYDRLIVNVNHLMDDNEYHSFKLGSEIIYKDLIDNVTKDIITLDQ